MKNFYDFCYFFSNGNLFLFFGIILFSSLGTWSWGLVNFTIMMGARFSKAFSRRGENALRRLKKSQTHDRRTFFSVKRI